jgi:hypothetical protein
MLAGFAIARMVPGFPGPLFPLAGETLSQGSVSVAVKEVAPPVLLTEIICDAGDLPPI